MYVMNAKLTLRMKVALIEGAKREAAGRGKSVSQMVGEFFSSLAAEPLRKEDVAPLTATLVGVLKGEKVSEESYKRHLREKYL
jgi:hypothetical protein